MKKFLASLFLFSALTFTEGQAGSDNKDKVLCANHYWVPNCGLTRCVTDSTGEKQCNPSHYGIFWTDRNGNESDAEACKRIGALVPMQKPAINIFDDPRCKRRD